jgi:hypothetical protein
MAEHSDLDRPLPKAPQPPNQTPLPPWEFKPEGSRRRYTPKEWARKVFGPKKKAGSR